MNNATELLRQLQDKCVNEVETNFNLYLLQDIEEAGGVDQLFDSQNWYLYYLECAWELNRLIDGLLIENERHKEQLIDAIKLKRVIDERLVFFNNDREAILDDLGYNQNFPEVISLTDKVKNADSFLKNLYKQLIQKGWTDSNLQEWLSNFFASENQVAINWVGRLYQLVGVIKYLSDERYIKQVEKPTQIIKRHFLRKSKPIIDGSISVYFSNALVAQDNPKDNYLFIDSCNE